jgi:DNA helicase-2/ATP-dependent DNA helicase PcrA
MYGKTDYTRESQFLREVDKHLLDGDAIYEKKMDARTGTSLDGCSGDITFKPFDQLKYAKQQTKVNASGADAQFAAGDRVKHAKFGPGTVLTTNGKIIQIEFDDGSVKKLAAGMAPLTKE